MSCITSSNALLLSLIIYRVEQSVYDLLRTRDMAISRYREFGIPTDWLMDSGVVGKVCYWTMLYRRGSSLVPVSGQVHHNLFVMIICKVTPGDSVVYNVQWVLRLQELILKFLCSNSHSPRHSWYHIVGQGILRGENDTNFIVLVTYFLISRYLYDRYHYILEVNVKHSISNRW